MYHDITFWQWRTPMEHMTVDDCLLFPQYDLDAGKLHSCNFLYVDDPVNIKRWYQHTNPKIKWSTQFINEIETTTKNIKKIHIFYIYTTSLITLSLAPMSWPIRFWAISICHHQPVTLSYSNISPNKYKMTRLPYFKAFEVHRNKNSQYYGNVQIEGKAHKVQHWKINNRINHMQGKNSGSPIIFLVNLILIVDVNLFTQYGS